MSDKKRAYEIERKKIRKHKYFVSNNISKLVKNLVSGSKKAENNSNNKIKQLVAEAIGDDDADLNDEAEIDDEFEYDLYKASEDDDDENEVDDYDEFEYGQGDASEDDNDDRSEKDYDFM